jgi:hypothetical protein
MTSNSGMFEQPSNTHRSITERLSNVLRQRFKRRRFQHFRHMRSGRCPPCLPLDCRGAH